MRDGHLLARSLRRADASCSRCRGLLFSDARPRTDFEMTKLAAIEPRAIDAAIYVIGWLRHDQKAYARR